MIFRRISYHIALQFTAFVFLLLFITGAIFLTLNESNANRFIRQNTERQVRDILAAANDIRAIPSSLPPFERDFVRLLDASGKSLYSGNFFEGVSPPNPVVPSSTAMTSMTVQGRMYAFLTTSVYRGNQLVGYIQAASPIPPDDISQQIISFTLVSVMISAMTFGVGLFFARRSLNPAEQMVMRLEQFTQDASHELHTPITAVSTSLDLALATGEFRENVLTAKKDLRDISTLVERLLDLARLDVFTLQKEQVNLSSLVHDVVERFRPIALERGIIIASQILPDVIVEGEESLLRQILQNLISNAIKFNVSEGLIHVELKHNALMIRDTGIGISSEALPHIFDRFFQEDTSRTKHREGAGLGLALVKRICDLHGWILDVESEKGKGTTFVASFRASK